MEILAAKQLKKYYQMGDTVVKALDGIDLSIQKGEFAAVVGKSGSGKSTLLHMLGGLDYPTGGEVRVDGRDISRMGSSHKGKDELTIFRRRKIGFVFQNYNLLPLMNVYENIAFGLKIKKMDKATIDVKVKEMLKLVALEGFEKRSIDSLSGGQQQRIAIARALVNEPKILLLDEPLGALDLKLRQEMQRELKKIQQKLGITFIFVTHDQEEALTMSDTIVVMNKGKIQQMGSPEDIYNEPKNSFVAKFIGESNIVDGVMLDDYRVKFCGREFECVDYGFEKNENIEVVIRPEDIKMVDADKGMLKGLVTSVVFKGVHYEMAVQENENTWFIHSTKMAEEGSMLGMDIYPEDIHIMRKVSDQ